MTTPWIVLLVALGAISLFVLWRATAKEATAESFLVAGRRVPLVLGMVTLGANWVQAPALLASGALAYQGPYHFLVFWVPNVFALILPVFFVLKVREVVPRGFTIPQYMGQVYGPTVRTLYSFSALTALVFAVGFTLTGLTQWLQQLLGLPTWQIAGTLGGFAFLWVLIQGLPGAIRGDIIKVSVIVAGMFGIVALWLTHGSSLPSAPLKPWTPSSFWNVLWIVGVPLAASLIGGPICNPDLGERVYALKVSTIRASYVGAAIFFGIAVIVFGSLGYLAHYEFADKFAEVPALAVLNKLASPAMVLLVSIGLSVILTAAIASYIASAGDLVAIEAYRRFLRPSASDHELVWASRITMPIPIILGTVLASTNGVSVTSLLASLAVIRGEAIIPILLAVYCVRQISGSAIATGMIVGFLIGVPLTYAEFFFGSDMTWLITNGKSLGALVAVGAPLAVYLFVRAFSSAHVKLA